MFIYMNNTLQSISLSLSLFLKLYLFLAVLGLHCCADFSLVAVSRRYSLVAMRGFLLAVASLVAKDRL